jgi:cation transporter-like permease
MAGSTVAGVLAGLSRREALAVGTVLALLVASHLVAPVVVPDYAAYARYATYLIVFSVWMAWFVDWLAVRLGQDPHPSRRDERD